MLQLVRKQLNNTVIITRQQYISHMQIPDQAFSVGSVHVIFWSARDWCVLVLH